MKQDRKQKLIILLIVFISSGLLIWVISSMLSQNINLFYTTSQIANGEVKAGERIRAGGMVMEKSIKRGDGDLSVEFVITDYKKNVLVKYKGILPDLFKEKQGVVVNGSLSADGKSIIASEVLAKHDENYMPPEIKDLENNTEKEVAKIERSM
jgi:cytochrome c-type biogenesis protein CcmE